LAAVKVELHPAARAEVAEAVDWYSARSVIAASAFVHEVDLVLEQAAEAPERWPKGAHGTRRLVFPRFPFVLIYRVRAELIEIVAIAHQRRRPGYWKRR
jgi:toxin ParE1/3/4